MNFHGAAELVREGIAAGATPGAVLLVGRGDEILLERAFGRLSYSEDAPLVERDTIYDLASLTKVIVTTTLAMIHQERGLLDLDSPVRSLLPEFRGGGKHRVTVRDLLAHCGGLLWWTDLSKRCQGSSVERVRHCYLAAICDLPLDYPPRTKTVYSDPGFLLLGEILQRTGGKSLDVLARKEIFEPLDMRESMYQPPPSLRPRIAPTEEDPWRGRLVHGEVHDDNAAGLGGVAPHAGVFSSARSLAPFPQMLLNRGFHNGRRFIGAETIALFTARANLVSGSSRALGWDTPCEGSSCGQYFSARSFGHTGFTGTSLWIDPERGFFVILLTNRVHPKRDNDQIVRLRRAVHDAIAVEL